MAKIVSTNA